MKLVKIRATPSLFPFSLLLFSFPIVTRRSFLFLLQWRNKLKDRIEHFQKLPCSRSDEKRRLEARKQDEGGIHLSKPKKAGKNERDWCPFAGTSMKNSRSIRGVMCSRCRTEVTNCDESMLFRSLLYCQDNQTFLKMLFQSLKFTTICVYLTLFDIHIYLNYVVLLPKLYCIINLINLKYLISNISE